MTRTPPLEQNGSFTPESRYDAVLVGAGIMSATLATLLLELDPALRLLLVERLEGPALESSAALNNAGTGHAANCELNYTPLQANGTIATAKALAINAAFERSLEFWASLSDRGQLDPLGFLKQTPHISAVWSPDNIDFLRQRFRQLSALPAFAEMQWSEDWGELQDWMPLLMKGRDPRSQLAATRITRGTDVDFGALTRQYLLRHQDSGSLKVLYNASVRRLKRLRSADMREGDWQLKITDASAQHEVRTPFVFLGAGGGALPLLQRSGIPEAASYAGFPVSGIWLICNDPTLAKQHNGKVYGKAAVGAPPMSVPHLDSRWIDGQRSLLFGPFAGFSSRFLKQGSLLDLPRSVRTTNLMPMLEVGVSNFELVRYLINQLRQSPAERHAALQQFLPLAKEEDWQRSVAGQRVQIIKRTKAGGQLQLGTEVVASADGSLAALLGASPGASTAVTIMLEVLERCFQKRLATQAWQERIKELIPSYGKDLERNGDLLSWIRRRNDDCLGLQPD